MPPSVTSVPEWVVECTRLQRLSLARCYGLASTPPTFLHCPGLRSRACPMEAAGRKVWKKE